MKKLGNIITNNIRTKYDVGLKAYKTLENAMEADRDIKVPTIIIGFENAKNLIASFNILEKQVDEYLCWTFSKTERGTDYYHDLDDFYVKCLHHATNKVEYQLIDVITDTDVKKKIEECLFSYNDKKYIYCDNNDFMFIYCPECEVVYGISLYTYGYVFDEKAEFIERIKQDENVINIKTFENIPFKVKNIVGEKIHKYMVLYEYFT